MRENDDLISSYFCHLVFQIQYISDHITYNYDMLK